MMRTIIWAALVAALAAPLPSTTFDAAAQTYDAAATTNTTKTTKPKKPRTPGQLAAQARQKKCAAEWKEAKAAGKIEKGATWPRYWSGCNKRLKAAGG
jgi:hypothetical protein